MWPSLPSLLMLAASFALPALTLAHSPLPFNGHSNDVAGLEQRARVEPQGLLATATQADIEAARKLVKETRKKMAPYKIARFAHPARNQYHAKPGSKFATRDVNDEVLLPVEMTEEILYAAALVAEADAAANPGNLTVSTKKKRAAKFWMETIDHSKGTVPWGNDPTYKVFRNVVDYGADPTGKKDSRKAIKDAMMDGKRCGDNCNGSTLKNAIVYFPAGKYLVSSQIDIPMGTQVIGDANDWPTLVANEEFIGTAVLSTNKYYSKPQKTGPDGLDPEWYVNTARFYSQIRNFRIDIRAVREGEDPTACIHYQIAQATSLEHVELIARSGEKYHQHGLFSENGSGGSMSDVKFTGGWRCFFGGNQQFSASRMSFSGCDTAAVIIWDWGWVWKSIDVHDCAVGFNLTNEDGNGTIGSMTFVDSMFYNIKGPAIIVRPPSDKPGTNTTGLVLDNVVLDQPIVDQKGKEILKPGAYDTWALGPIYKKGSDRKWTRGDRFERKREPSLTVPNLNRLLPGDPYFERARNQYADRSKDDFVHLKDLGAKGDGKTDDTKAVQDAFDKYGSGNKIIYVDAGTYLLTDTVTIPKDAKIVGETWSQFAATGDKFKDPVNPRVMLKVGKSDAAEIGTVEIQDLILTTKGGTAGAILMEWNVRALGQGAAALWDVHVRLGGAIGNDLTHTDCPPIETGTNPAKCQVASLLMHITEQASGYFDNMWLWVADHTIDDPDMASYNNQMPQLSVYSARGLLVESVRATWLYGTSSEHNVMYQYNFHKARNIYTTMIQTESPYFQPTPAAPEPFTKALGKLPGDPEYDCKNGHELNGCDSSWAVIMKSSTNIHIGGAGTYSWYSTYGQDCIDEHSCQKALWLLEDNYDNVYVDHLIGIGAKYLIAEGGKGILAKDNLAVEHHPRWSQISIFEAGSAGKPPKENDPKDKCDVKDNTQSAELTTDPPFLFTYMLDPQDPRYPYEAKMYLHYVTIVNLTPYKFRLVDLINNGLKRADFADVPPGKPQTATVDGEGVCEAVYQLEGTSRKFSVRYRSDRSSVFIFDLSGWNLGQREVAGFQQMASALVITGSQEYGYYSSVKFTGPTGWMGDLYDAIGDRELRHVIMPGSHDAGMSYISNGIKEIGDWRTTQTQGMSTYDQMRVGSRWFDMRIGTSPDGVFYAAHVSDEKAATKVGNTGETLDQIIDNVNRFTSETPGELIIFTIRYLVLLQYQKNEGDYHWNQATLDKFFSELRRIQNRCSDIPSDKAPTQLPLSYFLDRNYGKGCVLLLIDPEHLGGLTTRDDPKSGIYPKSWFPYEDHWSEKTEASLVASDQPGRWKTSREADKFAIGQWVTTLDIFGLIIDGIQAAATVFQNPTLYWYGVNRMSSTVFPNVILLDYIGFEPGKTTASSNGALAFEAAGPEIRALVMGLNLYTVSENCAYNKRRHPLRKPKRERGQELTRRDSRDEFRGMVWANGTVTREVPSGWHYGREEIWKKGTVFMNGTVLDRDVRNPYFESTEF